MSDYPSYCGERQNPIYLNFNFDTNTKTGCLLINDNGKEFKATFLEFDRLKSIVYEEREIDVGGRKKTLRQHKLTFEVDDAGRKREIQFQMSAGSGYWRSTINTFLAMVDQGRPFKNMRVEYSIKKDMPSLYWLQEGEWVKWRYAFNELPEAAIVEIHGEAKRDYREQNRFLRDLLDAVVIPALRSASNQAPAAPTAPEFLRADDVATTAPLPPPEADAYEDDLPF